MILLAEGLAELSAAPAPDRPLPRFLPQERRRLRRWNLEHSTDPAMSKRHRSIDRPHWSRSWPHRQEEQTMFRPKGEGCQLDQGRLPPPVAVRQQRPPLDQMSWQSHLRTPERHPKGQARKQAAPKATTRTTLKEASGRLLPPPSCVCFEGCCELLRLPDSSFPTLPRNPPNAHQGGPPHRAA